MAGLSPPRPLAAADDRTSFDCGRESLNQWLHRHAWRNHQDNVSRVSVVCAADGGIAAYVALSAAQIERAYLPKPMQRNRPAAIPVILLGQLAVDLRHQGKGLARSLLQFSLSASVRLSAEIGCFAVITHPLDDGVRDFYRRFGFEPLPFDPRGAMAVRIADLEHSGF